MKSKRMGVIMTAVAVLCFSLLAQRGPVAAGDAAPADALSGEQLANAAQTDGATFQHESTLQNEALPKTISPLEAQPCDKTGSEGAAAMTGPSREFAQSNCVPHGQKCTLGGNPCCSPFRCLGLPPNTTCQ